MANCTEYNPTLWLDGTAPAINAANLNKIEKGIKDTADCAINLEERVTYVEENGLPLGSIIMWSGTEVPTGWVICDGVHPDAPDLIDKFIRASIAEDVGEEGGSNDAVVVEHAHSGTAVTNGEHHHSYEKGNLTYIGSMDGGSDHWVRSQTAEWTSDNGAHQHSLDINETGIDGTDLNIPIYYSLMFIMRVS